MLPPRSTLRRRTRASTLAALTAAGLGALLLTVVPDAQAQSNPIADLFTTTTAAPAPASTEATVAPDAGDGSTPAPAGAQDSGDGTAPPPGGIVVPAEAQKIINAVKRSRPNDSEELVAALGQLTALGATQEEAYRIGMGRFPIAGVAHFSHDWLYPRYGPGFRFHLGTDVFAAEGTPVRAPVDGIAQTRQDTLGGLSVRVIMPDKTYFYLAHLSGLVEGFTDGMAVTTGDIVGYVGTSGNARGGSPHLHIGVYPKGGAPVDPKPVLDDMLADAEAALPAVVEAYRAAHPAAPPAPPAPPTPAEERRRLRPMLATTVLQPLAAGGDGWSPARLFLLANAPGRNAAQLMRSALEDLVASVG